jgi:hypothetical protein
MNKENLLRIVSGTAALVISTVFAAAYSWVNLNNSSYYNSGAMPPLPTQLFSKIAPFGLAIPLGFAVFSFYIYRKKDSGYVCHILLHVAYLFSFAWSLIAVWVWFLPCVSIGSLAP